MACFQPIRAWKGSGGGITFERGDGVSLLPVLLPCGKCIGCVEGKKRDWAIRCAHEASMHKENCAVMLSYNDEHLPEGGNLVHRDFQLFAKRARAAGFKFSYFMSGEYGGRNGRPHYHAILFGVDFSADRYFWDRTKSGVKLFRSPTLDRLWGMGIANISDFSSGSAFYIAGYLLKKANQGHIHSADGVIDFDTGELRERVPEYGRMSRNPAIGKRWFEKWKSDVFPRDAVVFEGRRYRPPRYYDKQLSELESESVKQRRMEAMVERSADNTPDRLRVREACAIAKHKARGSFKDD